MALPNYIQKTLRMKPEVERIFDDLEKWHDHCRFNLLPFNPADLYKSKEYRDFTRPAWDGVRRPYKGNKPNNRFN
jgi:transposase